MKIHTVRKYLSQLTRATEKNLCVHYKTLLDEVCRVLKVKPVHSITLAVVGDDAKYTAEVVSSAMKFANISSATIDFDIDRSPDEVVAVNGQKLPSEAISRVITVIRDVERNLVSKHPDSFSTPCAYEVLLLGALCACSQMGVSNIIISFNSRAIPTAVAALIPQPKMICCNAIYPEETECIAAVARKNVEEIISAPQQKDSRLALAALCSEINCNHTVVARGEIEVGTPTYRGIPFTYRNFSAMAGTHMKSMLVAPVTAFVTIRELSKIRIKLSDSHAYSAINLRKIPGRGQLVSIRPLAMCCTCDPSDIRFASYIANDLACLTAVRNRKLDVIIQGSVAADDKLMSSLHSDSDNGLVFSKIVTVTRDGEAGFRASDVECVSVSSFKEALLEFDYLKDRRGKDDRLLVVLGLPAFIENALIEVEDEVRDDFVY